MNAIFVEKRLFYINFQSIILINIHYFSIKHDEYYHERASALSYSGNDVSTHIYKFLQLFVGLQKLKRKIEQMRANICFFLKKNVGIHYINLI